MEYEQNLKNNTGKGTKAKKKKKNPKNAGKPQTEARKMYEKIYMRLLKCPTVKSTKTSQY